MRLWKVDHILLNISKLGKEELTDEQITLKRFQES